MRCAASPDLFAWLPEQLTRHLNGLLSRAAAIWGILAGGTVLMLLGLADDRRGLPWQMRIAVEFAVAGFCVYFLNLRFTAYIDLPWLTGLMSVIWIVALINSFNMLDNMDGLSGGVAVIATSMLAIMLLTQPDTTTQGPQLFVAAMLLVLVGALLGFLKHNWPPAKIFMGRCGQLLRRLLDRGGNFAIDLCRRAWFATLGRFRAAVCVGRAAV